MAIVACPSPTPVPHGLVVFVPADFKAAYTEFSTVADARLTENFTIASLLLYPGCRSVVCNAQTRETLLNLLVAHITAMRDGANGLPPGGMVGRISDAQEGSVRAAADFGAQSYGQAWYSQTQWGATYWAATARFRTARYIPPPPVCADLPAGGFGGPYGYQGN